MSRAERLNPLEFGADQLALGGAGQETWVLIPSNSGLISWLTETVRVASRYRLNPLEFGADQLALGDGGHAIMRTS